MASLRARVAVPPAWEPVGVDEVRAQARIDHTDEDVLLARYIRAAREWAERKTGTAIPQQQRVLELSVFEEFGSTRTNGVVPAGYSRDVPGAIELSPGPVISVDSLTYVDVAGGAPVVVAPADYAIDGAFVVPVSAWPVAELRLRPAAIALTYTAGYRAADLIPETISQWILMTAAQLADQRTPLAEIRLERTVLDWMLYANRETRL